MERSLTETINVFYQRVMRGREWKHSDKIGFLNLGYWKGVEDSMEVAQINLIERLASFFNKEGNILDVACGKGASSKFLTKYFDPTCITGINISEQQLEICRLLAPECSFKLMDATKLDFHDSSFDNVLCLEAALHFLTRHKFFEESYRVLNPGGRLAMLDFLCNYDLLRDGYDAILPRENYLPDLNAYRESLLQVGFKYVRVEDCTELTITAATNYMIRMFEKEFGKRQDSEVLEDIRNAKRHAESLFSGAMVYAIK